MHVLRLLLTLSAFSACVGDDAPLDDTDLDGDPDADSDVDTTVASCATRLVRGGVEVPDGYLLLSLPDGHDVRTVVAADAFSLDALMLALCARQSVEQVDVEFIMTGWSGHWALDAIRDDPELVELTVTGLGDDALVSVAPVFTESHVHGDGRDVIVDRLVYRFARRARAEEPDLVFTPIPAPVGVSAGWDSSLSFTWQNIASVLAGEDDPFASVRVVIGTMDDYHTDPADDRPGDPLSVAETSVMARFAD